MIDRTRRAFSYSDGASRHVIVGFTIFLLAMLWSGLALQLRHDRSAVMDTARVNIDNLARAYAEHVLGALTVVDQMVLELKGDFEKNSGSPIPHTLHRDASITDKSALMAGIADAQGYITSSSFPLPEQARDISDREYFLAHKQPGADALYMSQPMTGRITGRRIIAISRRLNSPDGAFAGIVFGSFDVQYLSGFFSDLTISENSSFTIVGRDMIVRDMIRGTGRYDAEIGKSLEAGKLVKELAQAPNGAYDNTGVLSGVPRLFAYRSLPGYPLIIIVSVAAKDVLAQFYQRESWLIGAATVLSLIFLAVAAFQLRRLTHLARAQQALRLSRENMARAQSVAGIGSFERDILSGKVDWSDEMFAVLGYEKGSIVPSYDAVVARVHPDDRERFLGARAAAAEDLAIGTLEFRIVQPDSSERVIRRENALTRDEKGQVVRFFGTYQDVTERRAAAERERALERQLLHSQKLEALGTLASGIAHDLNNTLVPIMALSKLAARNAEPGSGLRSSLDTIFSASEQARDLVKRVLAFSGRDQGEKKPTDLKALVREALALMRATIPTSIRLDERIGEVTPLLADASQIHQVVTNLVTNAAQAIGGGIGTITVTLVQRAKGTIYLSVADTGKGMDEATRRRIFEPFFTTKNVGQGTGLGLSIVERIVADHGGRIEVTSAPGQGARFDVFFAVAEARASAA